MRMCLTFGAISGLLPEVLRYDSFHKLGIPRWAAQDLKIRGKSSRPALG